MARLFSVYLLALMLSGCAAHYETQTDPYGFFSGVWHGLIILFSLLANLASWLLGLVGISFLESVQIVGRPNTGFGYYAGFVLGLAAASGSSSATRRNQ